MKKYLLLLLLMVIAEHLRSQDFGPGQQAQGYMDNKNVMVDHATGIFHYKVPLYTLRSGDFQLPIFLEYTAKGVKAEEQTGLIDYNWTLNTGGVVARMIRGELRMNPCMVDTYGRAEEVMSPRLKKVSRL